MKERKCIVAECKNLTSNRYLFCVECWQAMGPAARRAFALVFPPWTEQNWNVLDSRDRQTVLASIEAVRFAKSQFELFDDRTISETFKR